MTWYHIYFHYKSMDRLFQMSILSSEYPEELSFQMTAVPSTVGTASSPYWPKNLERQEFSSTRTLGHTMPSGAN